MINIIDMWRILGRGTTDGGLRDGAIINPKLGLQANRPASRTRTPTPERSEWDNFPRVARWAVGLEVVGADKSSKGVQERPKGRPLHPQGRRRKPTPKLWQVKTIRESVSTLPSPPA